MDALRWHAAGDVRLERVPRPETPPPGFSVVEVAFCGICGSDLAEFRDGPNLIRTDVHPLTGQAPPITLGHEFSGRIVTASDSSDLPVGTRVTADACWRCGECQACRTGAYHRCRYGGSIGLHSDGAFAERVVVPDYCLVAVPDSVSDTAAAMTEPLAVGLHALDRAGVRAADAVVVFGFGPIGAAAALVGRAIGARILVVEVQPARIAAAESLGFAALESSGDIARRIRRAIGGGGADVVVETTGVPAVVGPAIEATRRGGRIALAGLTNAAAAVGTSRLVLFERSLVGTLGYQHDLPRILELLAEGVIDPRPLIGAVVPLSAGAETIASLAQGPDERIKVLVEVGGSALSE